MSADREDDTESAEEWLAREGFDLTALEAPPLADGTPEAAEFIPDLDSYDRFLIGYSSGKDSQACLLYLLDLGATREDRVHAPPGRRAGRLHVDGLAVH